MSASPDILTSLGFIGGGQMAEAIIRGILAAGLIAPEHVLVAEPDAARCTALTERYRVRCGLSPETLCRDASVLILAVKPQIAAQVLSGGYRNYFNSQKHLLISIMAGVSLSKLAGSAFLDNPGFRLIRGMPNMPALDLAAATAFSANTWATDEDRRIATAVFSAIGTCSEVDERLLDAVTGLSGSGPGYVFAFLEAMTDAGVLAGLPRPIAEQLTLQTVYGSAKLALSSTETPSLLRNRVTSPGGTTLAGLRVLERGAFRGLIMDAVMAAAERSRELGA